MKERQRQLLRYVVNGLAATLVHYLVLYSCLEIVGVKSAGLANVVASAVGISVSFIGNRYFVFPAQKAAFFQQAAKFAVLYTIIATINGLVLFMWTDVLGLNYTVGFLIGVAVQVLIGYVGARRHVFVHSAAITPGNATTKAPAGD
jgi:putative flippase GtrA